MPRLVDLKCKGCGAERPDVMANEHTKYVCTECGGTQEQIWWPRRKRERTEWDERDAVLVFRKPDGTYSYPARNDRATPAGCERILLRSLRDVEKFEKTANVRSEIAWFDKGSGRGFSEPDRYFRGEEL